MLLLLFPGRDHGGIGRRAALKMRSPQGGEGSIPSGPTLLTSY